MVTVVVLVVGVVTTLSFRSYVNTLNDAEVDESLDALNHSYTRYHRGESLHHGDLAHVMLGFTGQNQGNVIAVLHHGDVIGSAVFYEDDSRPAPPDVVTAIEAQPWQDDRLRTATLGSLGSFRVDSQSAGADDRLIVGVSLNLANKLITRRIISATTLLIAAMLVTAGLTMLVVTYALRPLRRVAVTAAEVAGTPLIGDDHRITARVQPEDTDPDTEVGIVGHTLNRLLDNVDSALAHRAESDRRMRQFLTDASHELRTPLTTIRGFAELYRQGAARDVSKLLSRIESEASRMGLLVDDLLLLARLDVQRPLEHHRVDLLALASDAVHDAEAIDPKRIITMEVFDGPGTPEVLGDEPRIRQVLSNLVANALQHTPSSADVTVRVGTDGDDAVLEVADKGPGMSQQDASRVFERFYRTDSSRARASGGTGLGLSIVDSLVHAHGGLVTLRTAPGEGCCFRVTLPRVSDMPAAEPVHAS